MPYFRFYSQQKQVLLPRYVIQNAVKQRQFVLTNLPWVDAFTPARERQRNRQALPSEPI